MDEETLQNLRARADAKLSFAEIHLGELKAMGTLGGSAFDRAHQESFLFHLLGAKEAFLIELNTYYCGGLPVSDLTSGKLRAALKGQGKASSELAELYTLENDESSWLFHAKEMRDHSTHVSGVGRAFHMGGPANGQVWLRNPKTGHHIERHFVDEFDDWVLNMRSILERLRASAIVTMSSNPAFKRDALKRAP
ncbi:MAG: DUF6586 family protein [Methylococcaceae bacterium]|jgi:hypothetical protein